ncbi:MAG: hypothetical protein M3N21_02820, partial [Actinomycetota bacterium]|nr:hypothetical protein [Actinomycetota bacterium]
MFEASSTSSFAESDPAVAGSEAVPTADAASASGAGPGGPGTPSAPVVDRALEALSAAVGGLLAGFPADVVAPVALARQRALLVELERLRLVVLAGLRDIEVRGLYL